MEESLLSQMRERLAPELASAGQYPEVIGDRKLIRFLRGHDHNLNKACSMMSKFLLWRKEVSADKIRESITLDKNHPEKFPLGKKILSLIPQIILAYNSLDSFGSPLCVEQFSFSPAQVLSEISIEEYLEFIIYSLEYKSMIIEQLSEAKEREYLQEFNGQPPDDANYGVLLNLCVIRDLKGIGWEHIGTKGLEIIKTIMHVATDNYPEMMRKCFMVNTPWLFHTVWFVISALLPPRTLAKVNVMGTDALQTLQLEIPSASLPTFLGGTFDGITEPFPFDTKEGGLLWLQPRSNNPMMKYLIEGTPPLPNSVDVDINIYESEYYHLDERLIDIPLPLDDSGVPETLSLRVKQCCIYSKRGWGEGVVSAACEYTARLCLDPSHELHLLLRRKRVLDLSCGTALVTSACVILGCNVVASEIDDKMCLLAAENLALNADLLSVYGEEESSSASVCALRWGEEAPLFPRTVGCFEVCLLIEPLSANGQEGIDALVNTVQSLWCTCPSMILVMVSSCRKHGQHSVLLAGLCAISGVFTSSHLSNHRFFIDIVRMMQK